MTKTSIIITSIAIIGGESHSGATQSKAKGTSNEGAIRQREEVAVLGQYQHDLTEL